MFRRHTEIYCDRCKTMLKERRCGKVDVAPCKRREFFSCEKCLYSKRDRELVGGLAGSRRARSENVSAMDISESDGVRDLSLEASCPMFEQFPSEDVGRRRCEMESEHADVKNLGFRDLHLVELQVPR